jgi:hypothetical protein
VSVSLPTTGASQQRIIPTRFVRYGVVEQPKNHTGLTQVMDELFGLSIDQFVDADGTFTTFNRILQKRIIPEVSNQVVQKLQTPYDWCRAIYFVDGPGTPSIVLPYRNIAWVNVCFLRVLPSQPWYRFYRFRNTDGTEFQRINGVEPPQDLPETLPPNVLANSIVASSPDVIRTIEYTGIEDADLFVDTARRTIRIPPRVLIAGVQFPIWTYTFLPAPLNVETHFTFGFAPTAYENGNPLQYDPTSGYVLPLDPQEKNSATNPMAQINWSSGMPVGLTNGIARLVVNRILRRRWRITSNGLSSIGVDGGSESYGGGPYGGDLDKEDDDIVNSLIAQFGEVMVI